MSNKTHEIEIAVDTPDAEKFCAWLIAHGHSAVIGTTTGNSIDGHDTSSDIDANEIMRGLWETFCNE